MKVKCITDEDRFLTKDKIYEVFLDSQLNAYINDDTGGEYDIGEDIDIFEVVQEENIETNSKTLRDEFAMAAMTGDWASQDDDSLGYFSNAHSTQESLQSCAKLYYRMADAMLKVREENANTN